MLSLFACPKPFRDPHICIIQRNAIRSWLLLKDKPQVILVGDEVGVAEICAEFGLTHVVNVACNEKGTPRLDSVFREVQAVAKHDILCYVNADIVLMDDFIDAAHKTMSLKRALMLGARTDVDLREPIDFIDPRWALTLRSQALEHGRPMTTSSDYYLFRRGFFDSLPQFLVGRPAYDNWMIWYARRSAAQVVDATAAVLAIHQDHRNTVSWVNAPDESENDANRKLTGSWRGSYILQDANAVLCSDGVQSRRVAAMHHRVRAFIVLGRRAARRIMGRCWRVLGGPLLKSSRELR